VNGACQLECASNPAQCSTVDDCLFPAVCLECPDGSCAGGGLPPGRVRPSVLGLSSR
jgi:hypothetical protein